MNPEIRRMKINDPFEFTVLHAGTIQDLFSPKRMKPAGRGKALIHDPLGLPVVKTQCVHVGTEELSEGYTYVRCTANAVLGRHGYLCSDHGGDYYAPRSREYRNKDAEIVAAILATEERALRAERTVIRIGRAKMSYL